MWWLDRPALLARPGIAIAACTLALLGAACGFKPLYGEKNGAPQQLSRIKIDQIADRSGQQLRNLLLMRMTPNGQPERPAYVLKVKLREARERLAVQQDDVATRANLVVEANYVLERAADGKPVASGSLSSTNSYNILQSEYGTLSAEQDARVRAVHQLSEALTTRLALVVRAGG